MCVSSATLMITKKKFKVPVMTLINHSIWLLLLPLLAGCHGFVASQWDDERKLDWHIQREIVPKAASIEDVVKSVRLMGFRCGDYTDENRRSLIGDGDKWEPPNWEYEAPVAKICTAITFSEWSSCRDEVAILIGSCDGLDDDAKRGRCINRNKSREIEEFINPSNKVWAWVKQKVVCRTF